MAQIRASYVASMLDPATMTQHVESRVRFSMSRQEAVTSKVLVSDLEALMSLTIQQWADKHGIVIPPERMPTVTLGDTLGGLA